MFYYSILYLIIWYYTIRYSNVILFNILCYIITHYSILYSIVYNIWKYTMYHILSYQLLCYLIYYYIIMYCIGLLCTYLNMYLYLYLDLCLYLYLYDIYLYDIYILYIYISYTLSLNLCLYLPIPLWTLEFAHRKALCSTCLQRWSDVRVMVWPWISTAWAASCREPQKWIQGSIFGWEGHRKWTKSPLKSHQNNWTPANLASYSPITKQLLPTWVCIKD